jgi:hypothetical protein
LVPKPKTRGLALAREEKRTEFPYRWFRKKKKKKRPKENRRSFPWSKGKSWSKKKKKKRPKYLFYIVSCVLKVAGFTFTTARTKDKISNGPLSTMFIFSTHIQQQVRK